MQPVNFARAKTGPWSPDAQSYPKKSKVPKYGVRMVSILGIVLMTWGIYFILGTWTLRDIDSDSVEAIKPFLCRSFGHAGC